MTTNRFPVGWDEERVHQVLAHYESQSDEEAAREDERAYKTQKWTVVKVPVKVMPVVRKLIDQYLQTA